MSPYLTEFIGRHGPSWLLERQARYDELVAYFCGVKVVDVCDRLCPATFELHKRIVRILDGMEPDPRKQRS